MSTAGLGALFSWVFNLTFLVLAIVLIVKSRKHNTAGKLWRFTASIVILGLFIASEVDKQKRLDQSAIGYLGRHKITGYRNSEGDYVTISKNHCYFITHNDIIVEQGAWHYFDDGDIAFIEYYPNGNQFSHYFDDGQQYGDIEE